MKRILQHQKAIFALFLALCLGSGTAYAYDFSAQCSTGQMLYYNITDASNHYVELTFPGTDVFTPWDGFTKPTGPITLPSSVTYNRTTYTVKTIGHNAFDSCTGLTGSLTIPNTVTSVGYSAFIDCTGFTGSLTIGNSVTSIGDGAFNSCGFTGTLTLPNSLTTIEDSAFGYCDFTGTLTIPNSVTTLGEGAFFSCDGFTGTLNIPNSLTVIEDDVFRDCSGFTGLIIPNTITSIGKYAFCYCTGLTGPLTIPDSVTEIGECAFEECYGFSGPLTISNSLTAIAKSTFQGCSGLTGPLTIPNSVATIGDYAFFGCWRFTGPLTIPSSVNTIGEMAFAYCDGFTGPLTIPNSVNTIREMAFAYCGNFTDDLTIGKNVASIGPEAFLGCTGFTHLNYNAINCADFEYLDSDRAPFKGFNGTLNIGDGVRRIPDCMFWNCTGFTGSLIIPSSVTSIGYGAFYKCTHLTHLYLGNSLTTIDIYAFYNCYRMTGMLTIPESVTTIGTNAFANCYGFSSLTIGSNVSTIDGGAFYGCTSLTSMTVLPETPPTLGTDVFENDPMGISVYVPCDVIDDYRAAPGWSEFTNYDCIPWKVTLSANPWGSGTVDFVDSNGTNGNYADGLMCIVEAFPNDGYQFMHWVKNDSVVSSNLSYSFNVYENTELEAVFISQSDLGTIIGSGTNISDFLPSISLYNYSLTEQIYTASELGGITTITSISFFNAGTTKTRSYDIYMKHTPKTAFSSNTDWISVISTDLVYSGSVTMRAGQWTTIVLDTPISYDNNYNLALIVDDNTGTWSSGMSCRTYAANGNQALLILSDDTNYNPYSPTSYSGDRMPQKNQIMLNRSGYNIAATSANTSAGTVTGGGMYGQGDQCRLKATPKTGYTFLDWTDETGMVISTEAEYTFFVTESRTLTAHFLSGTDVCSLTFDLYDSYGDGWNNNYLVADFGDGSSHRLTISSDAGSQYSYTLPVVNGNHVELGWIQANWANECFFKVSYSNGNIAFASVGVDLNANFEYGFDMDCDETPASWVFIGYDDNGGSNYLPSHSYYKYSLTQQIYSADEIGTEGYISSIAFYNEGGTKTRTYDIYMKAVGKYEFASGTNWISVTEDDKVFSGEVTMTKDKWTSITFDTPFDYDGTSNVVLVMDDNTGTWSSGMSCRTFDADGNQALYIYDDNINFDPNNPSAYVGTLLGEKNQIYLGIMPACPELTDLTVDNITSNSAEVHWTGEQDSYNVRYRTIPDGPWVVETTQLNSFMDGFEDGLDQWTLIDADGDGRSWDDGQINGCSAHGGSIMAFSFSWYGGYALTPDNYLVTPCVNLGGTVTFWASAGDLNDAAEHFGIAVSTASNTNPSDFTMIQEWTMTAKGGGQGGSRGNRDKGTWYQYTVDLSAYAGQTGYIALRHFNCTDQFALAVDDFSYVAWVIPSGITLMGLNPTTTYEVQVQGICPYGIPEWSESITFTTAFAVVTQTIALSAGVNWFSTYVEITLDDLKAALEEALPGANNIVIQSKNQNTTYNGTRWRGQLNTLDVASMYKITVEDNCQISLTGMPINPAEHPITIAGNAVTWIGFPFATNMTIEDAFAGFAVSGDQVSAKGQNTTYNGTRWRGQLNTLEPGKGYIYQSASSTPRVLSFAQHDYVDLGLPSGLLWATCNVGANAPEEYGDYFAWGETMPKDVYKWDTYQYGDGSTFTKYSGSDGLTTLLPEDDAATANWGSGWRMPTVEDWEELYNNTTVTWTTQNGVNGQLFTGSNGNSLFLPAAGYRYLSDLYEAGSSGYYWSSSLVTDNPDVAWDLYFGLGDCAVNGCYRYYGPSVRAVRVGSQN